MAEMEKTAVISDIHGNLEALRAVLKDAEGQGVVKIYCAGDVVGYGANPAECLEWIMERGIPCVMGNHDEAVVRLHDGTSSSNHPDFGFNGIARKAIEWTSRQLSEEHFEFLRNLPYTISFDSFIVAHASLVNPEQFLYLFDYERLLAIKNLKMLQENQKLFVGHTHIPVGFAFLKGALEVVSDFYDLNGKSDRAVVNVGSVGQPRDGDKNASYVVYGGEVKLRRVEYDIGTAAGKIEKAGLPKILADRLFTGQ